MAQTFFFYDLETSGLNPRQDRIMQFAGQRTDMNLEPIDEPYNLLVTLNDDTLPSPDALMVTGITPQKTVEEGYTEAQFARMLSEEIFTPETIAVGFNNIRFDDEFIRHLLWRNFHDPYEWSWKDGRSRWDLLDVVRLTRALRPEGINWPLDDKGGPSNRLELITSANGIAHENAHDALADVTALIAVTKLIKQKQPQLYDYLLKMRDKKVVQQLVNVDDKKPFVYASGRYDKEFAKTTVAFSLTTSRNGGVVVYDLRYDPTPFVGLSVEELSAKLFASWEERQAEDFVKLPVKELQYNRCPAVAPLGVLEQGDGWQKISLDLKTVQKHQNILLNHPDFAEKLRTIFENKPAFKKLPDPEAQLYDGFLNDRDRIRVEAVRNADERELADFHPEFQDERLAPLLLHYKARNFPRSLSEDDLAQWETWRAQRLQVQLPGFMTALHRLAPTATDEQQFILQELQLWAESTLPASD
ncbi:exodeoxyribonuclease I [Candidatus Nanosynsacchari sp. TM7_ANC_38.39_G1_1]|uniref:exodeoxyribonuclease I n=1 Tax=Candidatus Nanosynsacchari sp. TM7_ANC_38.39_G1_1 TaxID=1986206 RepID=UPI00101CB580|nr:exodeoxyribonuclease I [Candidatus Nanosynsacchari sp. TM7_ANC_38.39_G1_1]RYC73444.1 Exodeoxyribonuclease I [Candidatus Nanosynsacchari sp. TM7_ANC_38.39_G1_1]